MAHWEFLLKIHLSSLYFLSIRLLVPGLLQNSILVELHFTHFSIFLWFDKREEVCLLVRNLATKTVVFFVSNGSI